MFPDGMHRARVEALGDPSDLCKAIHPKIEAQSLVGRLESKI